MGKIMWIPVLMLGTTLALHAQVQPPAGQQQTHEPAGQQQNAQPAQNDGGSENAKQNTPSTADTPGAAEAASATNKNNNQADTSANASNTPAVTQITTSASGSPAVMSENNGGGRDGTNTVQRASMNMAGSPVSGVRINSGDAGTADQEIADRQNYEQDKGTSAQRQSGMNNGSATGRGSNDINEKSRLENNDLSDQNLSAKEKNASQNPEKKSQDSKSRKKKNRG